MYRIIQNLFNNLKNLFTVLTPLICNLGTKNQLEKLKKYI